MLKRFGGKRNGRGWGKHLRIDGNEICDVFVSFSERLTANRLMRRGFIAVFHN